MDCTKVQVCTVLGAAMTGSTSAGTEFDTQCMGFSLEDSNCNIK